jgi:acyl-coenzyme A synthetase/AMP-(fatty) acid ligase
MPSAFVKLKEGCDDVGTEELIKFCMDHLSHYMASRTNIFGDLPKTSTGKTQKLILREKAKVMSSLS